MKILPTHVTPMSNSFKLCHILGLISYIRRDNTDLYLTNGYLTNRQNIIGNTVLRMSTYYYFI